MTHRALWKITGAVAVAALIILGVAAALQPLERAARDRETLAVRINSMMALLDKDPRVRRPETRQAVEAVASAAATSSRAETQYALGLKKFYGEENAAAAEKAFREAIDRAPGWAWPHNALGIVLFMTGREEEGLEAFHRAMELEPDWSRPHSDLAIVHRIRGDFDKAVEEVKTALDIEPDEPINHYNYGVILDVQGRDDEAKAVYERVIEMDPNLPAPYYNLACWHARRGDLDAAYPHLERAIERNENLRVYAREDDDFDAVRADPRFQALVNPDDLRDER